MVVDVVVEVGGDDDIILAVVDGTMRRAAGLETICGAGRDGRRDSRRNIGVTRVREVDVVVVVVDVEVVVVVVEVVEG